MKESITRLFLIPILSLAIASCGVGKYGIKTEFTWEDVKNQQRFSISLEPYFYVYDSKTGELKKTGEKKSLDKEQLKVDPVKCKEQKSGYPTCYKINNKHFYRVNGKYIPKEKYRKSDKIEKKETRENENGYKEEKEESFSPLEDI